MLARFNKMTESCYDYDAALKRQNLKQEWVDQLREMIKQSPYVPKVIDDRHLLIFINLSKQDIERASKWMHLYFKFRATTPEFYSKQDPTLPNFKHAYDNQIFVTLPNTPDNHCVFYYGISNYEPRNYIFEEGCKNLFMLAEAKLGTDGPNDGVIYLLNLQGARFGHIFRPDIHLVRKGLEFLQSGNPMNIKSVHVLNSFWFMDLVFAMIKPFLKQHFYERFHLHPIGDYSGIYQDCPKSILPKELGGDLETIMELHGKTKRTIESMREYFQVSEIHAKLEIDQYVHDKEYKYHDRYQDV